MIDLHVKLTEISLFMRQKLRDFLLFDNKNFSLNQYRVLRVLKENPNLSLSSLDEKIIMKKGNLSRIVEKMVQQNFIHRQRDTASDRRKISLSLTKKGDQMLDELNRKQEELIKVLYQSIPEEEIKDIYESLTLLEGYMQKVPKEQSWIQQERFK